MSRSPLLYLAPDGLHCYRRQRHTTEHIGHFSPEVTGHEAFEHWLRGFSTGTSFTVLVDLPDERFKIEVLPHLNGPDRKHLRERRQAQIFPDTPFVAHQYLDREQSGRKDDRILFVALNRPSAITPWLDAIEHVGHRLKRLAPIPFLTAALAHHLPVTRVPQLLVLLTPAGLRVSCVEDRKLLFSHLRPGSPAVAPPLSQWMSEARETYRHLLSQRLASHGTSCTCYLLAAPDDDTPFSSDALPNQGDLHFVRQDLPHLATGVPQPSTCGADSLPRLLSLLDRHPQLSHATPANALFSSRLDRIGLALKVASAIFLLLCGALSIEKISDIKELKQRSVATRTRGDTVEQSLTTLVVATPATPYPLAQLQTAVDALRHLRAAIAGPEPALRELAAALSPVPDNMLRSLNWSSNSTVNMAKETMTYGQHLTLHFALPSEAPLERIAHTQRILSALQAVPGAQVRTEHPPVKAMTNQALSQAALAADTHTADLIVHIDLPDAQP